MFAKEAIDRTSRFIDKAEEDWITFNDKINTRIIHKENEMKVKIDLLEEEIPLFECILSDSFVLISTKRLVSKLNDIYDEIFIKEITGLNDEFEKLNYNLNGAKQPKTHLISVQGINNNNVVFKIDSYYPAFFARILIYNLSCYSRTKKWYLQK